MTRKSKKRTLEEKHAFFKEEFAEIQSSVRGEREQCLSDRRFYSIPGAQWEGQLGEEFANRPQLEVNKVHVSVMRIISEYRANRITADFVPKDGSGGDETCDTCNGLYRSDEQSSSGEEAYDNAFEEGIGGGMGAWRLCNAYEDEYNEENEYQRIIFEPIYDADSCVFWDLHAKRQDKSDAKRCYVLTRYSRSSFIDEFDSDPVTWPRDIEENEFDWYDSENNYVYVAEVYEVEEITKEILFFQAQGSEVEKYDADEYNEDEELQTVLSVTGSKLVGRRKVKRRKVHKYIMDGNTILEDCGFIAGTEIPIVPFYAKRWFVDGIERCMGHVRLSKDAQRLKNMLLSRLAEISAKGVSEKPIFAAEQVQAHSQMWAMDNIEDYPYMLVDPIEDKDGNMIPTGPLGYTKPAQMPQAVAALLELSDMDIKELLGSAEAGEQIADDLSGKAVELIQVRLDMQSYIYMSNFSKAIQRSGQIWLSMASDVLTDRGRKMKTLDIDNNAGQIELMKSVRGEDGKVRITNDFSVPSKYEVFVDVGPSSSSRRQMVISSMLKVLGTIQDPESATVLSSFIIMNLDGEGLSDIRDWFRMRLIRMGVVKPNKDEEKQLAEEQQNVANQPPNPQEEYLRAEAENSMARTEKARADAMKSMAQTEEIKAQTVEIMAGIDRDDQNAAINAMSKMVEAVDKSRLASNKAASTQQQQIMGE